MSPLLLVLAAPALAAEPLDHEEAERLARLFYTLTGRAAPEAFLQDDVEVLLDSGRSPEELEEAIRWIALKVPGADSYTLAGLLESHLATALGEEEELVLPDAPPESTALARVEQEPLFHADPLFKQQVLTRFYVNTGREPPEPPTAEDLAAFDRLSWEHWSADGMLRLADWVPANVRGAEDLSWAQVADVAVEKGYNGGPRPDGQLEQLIGVRAYPGTPQVSWVEDRDPRRFDGGGTVSMVSMGALPSWLDAPVARLPGRPLRVAEVAGGSLGGGVQLGQATPSMALTGQLLLSPQVPGSLDSQHRLDGEAPWQLDDAIPQMSLGGRLGAATRQGFLGFGGSAYGLQGGDWSMGGVALSMDQTVGRVSVTQDLGLGGRREVVDGLIVQGQVLHGELSTWLELSATMALYAGSRLSWTSGGLLEDGGPIGDDVYDRLRLQGSLGLLHEGPSLRLGALVQGGYDRWSVGWNQNSLVVDRSVSAGERQWRLAASVGVEQELPWSSDWWLSAGARGVVPSTDGWVQGELALGTRKLVMDAAWMGLGLRAGRGLTAQGTVSLPF